MGALGIAEYDVGQPVTIARGFAVGNQQVTAWLIGGPAFVAAGGGARLLISGNIAITGGAKIFAAFGGGAGFLPGLEPELGAQMGF
jgi:hypothetical protein